MQAEKIESGLWRWTAPHPEWRPEQGGPGGWERDVACVYYEAPAGSPEGVLLIDPLAPPAETPEAAAFWEALDRDVERRGRPVAILLTGSYHQRSASEIRERYRRGAGASIWAPEGTGARLSLAPDRLFRSGDALPGGLRGHEIPGPEIPEVAYEIPERRALVLADALIGAGGGCVRLAPRSWAEPTPEGRARYAGPYVESVRRLGDLPVEILLVAHGAPVLRRGQAAIREAIGAAPWGDR
jgi:glyoxylase-like metal-dependent hydrolase (beta-lactamase superfamily II)